MAKHEHEGWQIADHGAGPYCRACGERLGDVTRFEVIGSIGRQYVAYDVSVRLELQDDGRTLKVFLEHRDDTDVQAEMHAGLTEWAREREVNRGSGISGYD